VRNAESSKRTNFSQSTRASRVMIGLSGRGEQVSGKAPDAPFAPGLSGVIGTVNARLSSDDGNGGGDSLRAPRALRDKNASPRTGPCGSGCCVVAFSVCGKRQAECGLRQAACGKRQAESSKRPAASGLRQAECGKRQAASGNRNAASGQRPAESGQRPAASGKRQAESGKQQAAQPLAKHAAHAERAPFAPGLSGGTLVSSATTGMARLCEKRMGHLLAPPSCARRRSEPSVFRARGEPVRVNRPTHAPVG